MSLRGALRTLVRHWSAAQALAVARILRELSDVIWEVHGEQMILDEEYRDYCNIDFGDDEDCPF